MQTTFIQFFYYIRSSTFTNFLYDVRVSIFTFSFMTLEFLNCFISYIIFSRYYLIFWLQFFLNYSSNSHFFYFFELLWFCACSHGYYLRSGLKPKVSFLPKPKFHFQRFWLVSPPTPLRWHFLPYKSWQKADIFILPSRLLLST